MSALNRRFAYTKYRAACYLGLVTLFVTFLFLALPPRTNALTPGQLIDYAINSIYFYDPDACDATPSSNGIYKGTVFTGMDDRYLNAFARAAAAEQGSLEGVKFELSIMANLYDKNCARANGDCSYTASSLEHYLLLPVPPGWFASSTKDAYVGGGSAPQEYIDAAKDILVNGNRTLPQGIDEHDGIGDYVITSSPTGSTDTHDASNYVSGQTKIHNGSGSDWTFYSWCDGELSKTGTVTSMCDPFGYTGSLDDEGGLQKSYSTVTSVGENKLYNGNDVLSAAQLQQVEANKPTYEKIATKYNLPWQLLAALHYREHNFAVDNPANGEGMYQLTSLTNHGSNENAFKPAGPVSQEEFERQTDLAAQVIRGKIGQDIDLMNNDDNVKRVMFMYNWANPVYVERAKNMGFTEEQANNGEGSPYVMNMADAARDPGNAKVSPYWTGLIANLAGKVVADDRPGAFVVFEALGGGSGEGTDPCRGPSGNGDIAATAINLSWDGRERGNCGANGCDPKPEYVTAMDEVGTTTDKYQGGNYIGASCDQFVTTVMRYSKVDPEYPLYIADALQHMISSDAYEEITYNGDDLYGKLQPGDIFIFDNSGTGIAHGHIFIYVEINGKQGQASASAKQRSGQHFDSIYYTDMGGARKYRVFRRTK
ncbi:hypothetical protein IKG60_01470 [Candidatus Saccharibacteria bacterium]|nr:hypothetical protein [Candidatus Saccharibacteria bacterium]